MKTATLNNGLTFPLLGLGTWKSPKEALYQAVRHAIKIGYRHIDCAAIYENEDTVGEAIHDALKEGDVTREALWITSKLWNSFHDPKFVESACRQTLNDLQLDYLDLYLIHWPVAFDPAIGMAHPTKAEECIPLDQMPIKDTWQAMEQLVDQGLVKTIGVSNFSIGKLKALQAQARIQPAVNQVEGHPYLAQPELLNYCKQHDIVLTGYSPLGSTDRPEAFKAKDEPSLLENPVIQQVAQAHNASAAQILIAWHLSRGVSVIPKSVTPARIEQNLAAAQIRLTQDDMQAIAKLDKGYRFIHGGFWDMPGSPYTADAIWS